jgi:hypothetical protein
VFNKYSAAIGKMKMFCRCVVVMLANIVNVSNGAELKALKMVKMVNVVLLVFLSQFKKTEKEGRREKGLRERARES